MASPSLSPAELERAVCGLFAPPPPSPALSPMQADAVDVPLPGPRRRSNSSDAPLRFKQWRHDESLATDKESVLSRALDRVGADFLRARVVNTDGVSEADLAQRFTNTAMPADGHSVHDYMHGLVDRVVRDSVHCSAPQMIGHMTSSLPFYSRPLAKLLTSLNQNSVKTETAKTVTFLEREALAMIHRVLYDRDEAFYAARVQSCDTALGVFTSGGTLANTTALWIARNRALGPDGEFEGVAQRGLFAAMRHYGHADAVVIASALVHYSLTKALDLLGLGSQACIKVPFDADYRVDVTRMEAEVLRCRQRGILVLALVGVAGATETGSIDDLEAIASLAEAHGIHFHVDAAWGGPCVFSRAHRGKLTGIGRAATVTLDGHKQLYMPMGCGLCLLREPESINSVRKTAQYIIRADSHDLGKFTVEGSRPANSLFLHSNLSILGVRGYEVLVDRSIRLTQFMAQRILALPEFELVAEHPMTNILLYRFLPLSYRGSAGGPVIQRSAEDNAAIDAVNVQLQNAQKAAGRTFVSRTTIASPRQGTRIVALRVVLANPLTAEHDIEAVLQDQLEIMRQLLAEPTPDSPPRPPQDVAGDGKATPSAVPPSTGAVGERASAACADDGPDGAAGVSPTPTSAYWDSYWEEMPAAVKLIFKNERQLFVDSLVAPSNPIEGTFVLE